MKTYPPSPDAPGLFHREGYGYNIRVTYGVFLLIFPLAHLIGLGQFRPKEAPAL
jgi:hypothetical protein